MPSYDDPNRQIEQFLKDIWGVVWSTIKWAWSIAVFVFREGFWVFKEAIPKERPRRRF